ncbi:hypothetical protein AB0L65_20715 [Nonomuraea sp. NPDC052116]|uniref:hypothetical protein n=1 Tax=Nonomuraea sp. NPDC052116 TaxID=3155665 RepID=UPI0034181D4F
MSEAREPVDHRQEALDVLAAARNTYGDRSDTPNAIAELIADQIPAIVHALLYVGDQLAKHGDSERQA